MRIAYTLDGHINRILGKIPGCGEWQTFEFWEDGTLKHLVYDEGLDEKSNMLCFHVFFSEDGPVEECFRATFIAVVSAEK